MKERSFMALTIALLMFPQIAQTLYSPALADFSRAFAVPPDIAAQALSVYFLAFAIGVALWGRACDYMGRRMAMLAGLTIYAGASAAALAVNTFDGVLITQACAAFGVSVGSVVTQTILRDRFEGAELAKAFSIAGIVLAASPALGLFTGERIVQGFGYRGVMACLLGSALLLWGWSALALPETRPATQPAVSLFSTLRRMAGDPSIWRSAALVALFNVALFSYYALGPFLFQRLHLRDELYGYSGAVLAVGASAGSWLNKKMLARGAHGDQLVRLAAWLTLGGGMGVCALQETEWFLAPVLVVVLAFGLAIPNLLGKALATYQDRLGTAGALFGLLYYLMIGAGMMAVGWSQALGGALTACGGLAILLCIRGARSMAR